MNLHAFTDKGLCKLDGTFQKPIMTIILILEFELDNTLSKISLTDWMTKFNDCKVP